MITSPDLALVHALRDTVVPVSDSDRHDLLVNALGEARLVLPLFEEPGTLGAVARLASAWFRHFLAGSIAPDVYLGTPPPHSPQA
jgi:hypothetical protein